MPRVFWAVSFCMITPLLLAAFGQLLDITVYFTRQPTGGIGRYLEGFGKVRAEMAAFRVTPIPYSGL